MKETKLRKYFNDEESYNNILNIYRKLRGKENLKLRRFLKLIVICCIEAQTEQSQKFFGKWMTPDAYFTPTQYASPHYCEAYTVERLKKQYRISENMKWRSQVFGRCPIDYKEYII